MKAQPTVPRRGPRMNGCTWLLAIIAGLALFACIGSTIAGALRGGQGSTAARLAGSPNPVTAAKVGATATARPAPTSTAAPTATRVPPTPMAEPSLTPEEQAYADALAKQAKDWSMILKAYSRQLDDASANPRLLADNDWRIKTVTALVWMQSLADDADKLDPPESMLPTHDRYTTATARYREMTHLFIEALDDGSIAKMQGAAALAQEGNQALNEANSLAAGFLEERRQSPVVSVTESSAEPDPTEEATPEEEPTVETVPTRSAPAPVAPAPKPSGSGRVPPASRTDCPASHPVKGNQSGIYHVPGGQFYSRTNPEACFATAADAQAAGYRASQR